MDGLEISLGDYPPEGNPFTAITVTDRQTLIDLLSACKKRGHNFEITMPCGYSKEFKEYADIPFEDLPCPCGRTNRYLIRLKE